VGMAIMHLRVTAFISSGSMFDRQHAFLPGCHNFIE